MILSISARLFMAALLSATVCGAVPAQDAPATRSARDDYIRAQAYEGAQARDSAVAAYLRAIRVAPSAPFADTAVARVRELSRPPAAVAEAPYAAATRLAEIGMHGAALVKAKETATEYPHAEVPPVVMALVADSVAWWPTLRRRAEAKVRPVLEAATVAFLLGIPLLLVVLRYARPRVEFGEFDATGVEQPSAQSFGALVRQHIERLTRGASSRGTHAGAGMLVRGPVEGMPLPATIQAVLPAGWAWMQAVPALLSRLSTRPTLRVTGQLHRPGQQGLGATLFISKSSVTVSSHTLWEKDFRDGSNAAGTTDGDASALAEAAAVWLIFHLNAGPRRFFGKPAEAPRLVGTADWRSYALFRAGVRYAEGGSGAAAERCYSRALARDPANRAARVNLASRFIARDEEVRAIGHLERALRECEDEDDAVRYPALYALAVARFHAGEFAQAERDARLLVDYIDAGLRRSGGGKQPDLHSYLRTIETPSRALHLGTWAKSARNRRLLKRLASELAGLTERAESGLHWFTLACSHWIVRQKLHETSPERTHASAAILTAIERACELDVSYAGRVRSDPVLNGLTQDPVLGGDVMRLVARFRPRSEEPTSRIVTL
jgi:tetratricopeptide (TPR) repeat protein